jgi:hypothetical protein
VCGKVGDRSLDWTWPDEAQVTVPWANRKSGDVVRRKEARAVDVELSLSQPVGDSIAGPMRNELGAQDLAVEPIRDVPIRDADDAVVEANSSRGPRFQDSSSLY